MASRADQSREREAATEVMLAAAKTLHDAQTACIAASRAADNAVASLTGTVESSNAVIRSLQMQLAEQAAKNGAQLSEQIEKYLTAASEVGRLRQVHAEYDLLKAQIETDRVDREAKAQKSAQVWQAIRQLGSQYLAQHQAHQLPAQEQAGIVEEMRELVQMLSVDAMAAIQRDVGEERLQRLVDRIFGQGGQ